MARSMMPFDVRLPGVLCDFRREMDSMLNRVLESTTGEASPMAVLRGPAVNVAESEAGYDITADLPGMKSEDLRIELKDRQLWISGERQEEQLEEGKTWQRMERQYGRFERMITLAADVDEDNVQADYADGVLHIYVPKVMNTRSRKIQVVCKGKEGNGKTAEGGATVG